VSLSIAIFAVVGLCRDERNLRIIKQGDRQILTGHLVGIKYDDPPRDERKANRIVYVS